MTKRRKSGEVVCARDGCGVAFMPWNPRSRFCSKRCSNQHKASLIEPMVCRQCGGSFKPYKMARSRAGNVSRTLDLCPPCQTSRNQDAKKALPWWHKRVPMMICNARIRAERFGREFDLKPEDIKIPDVCPVFGVPFSRERVSAKNYFAQSMAPSIDRVDSSKGYTPDNIVIVSCRANSIKSNATAEELMAVAVFYNSLRSKA